MLPKTTTPAIGGAMAETVARVNGETEPMPNGEGTELARLQAQVAHYKALANGDGVDFDKLTARIDTLQRERDELQRKIDKPAVTLPTVEGSRELIQIAKIVRTGGTQTRSALDERTVENYALAMEAGDMFPVIKLVYDGKQYLLVDGFHRVAAAEKIGKKDMFADVIQGTSRDAIWRSFGANKEHDKTGLRRTNADKQKAVKAILTDAEWAKLSDREIARHCGVDNKTVSNYRKSICGISTDSTPDVTEPAPAMTAPAAPAFPAPSLPAPRLVTRNGTTYPMNTSAIGSKPSAPPRTQYQRDEFSQQAPDDVPMVDDDDFGDLPPFPFDDTPELPPAVAKQPSPLAPLPQGEGNGWARPMSEIERKEEFARQWNIMHPPPPLPAPVPSVPSEEERAAALAARQALMTAQPNTALDAVGERDYWPDAMTLRQAIKDMLVEIKFAFGLMTETRQKIEQIGNKALSATDHR